jgi:DNA-binding transcriptional LysR family regulator
MNIVDLESFVAVVDCGSIVAAAARLHITQSAISRRIQNLEDSLGVSLLDRQTRPLQLTAAGKAMYENARPVLSSVNDLKSAVVHDGEPSGTFRFGIAHGLGDGALTRPIEALRREFPLLQLQSYSQWSEPLLDKLRSRSIDAAAILLPSAEVPPVTLDSEYLGKQQFVIVGQKTTFRTRTTTLEELSSCTWVLSPEGCGTRNNIESVLLRRGLPFQIAVEAEGKELQLSLVAQGVGLGIVPSQVFYSSVYRRQLSVLRAKDFEPIQDLWLVSSKHIGRRTKVVQALKSALLSSHNQKKASAQ